MNKSKTIVGFICAACLLGCSKQDPNVTDSEPYKPFAEITVKSPADDPTLHNVGEPDPEGQIIRERSIATLSKAGFNVAPSLPTAMHRRGVPGTVRPMKDVALRLMAFNAAFTWASAPEAAVSSDRLKAYIQRSDLLNHMTPAEAEIISLSRDEANQQHGDVIGWRLENMWALAWVLGFEEAPNPTLGQIPDEITRAVVMEFLPGLDTSLDDLMQKAKPRSKAEIVEMEDVFYCSHNAVRSAQTGSATSVPDGFHPVRDGGAIHERRHALTWTISPGVAWDDTDLST